MASPDQTLRPYQDEGADFLMSGFFRMLGDDPGLGKSRQAIEAALRLGANRVLILCPAIAKVSWEKQIEEWAPKANAVFFTHSYDTVGLKANQQLRINLRGWKPDVVVLDEGHYLKNISANRTKAVYGRAARRGEGGIADGAKHVFAMSGTFAPNHAGELFPHLSYAGVWTKGRTDFEDAFCKVRDTTFGRQIVGSKNIPQLRALMAPIYLKRRKQDVLTEIPPLQFVDEPLDLAAGAVPEEFSGLSAVATDEEILAWLTQNTTHLASARRLLGLAKVEPAAQWAEGLLAAGVQKLVLFAVHTDVVARLAARLVEHDPVHIMGATSHADRIRAVDRFQGDPNCRVFIGQMQAAGTAITLTAASDVGIVEASWTPADNYQAACRCHRIGQRDGVIARFLHAPGTIDARIAKTFRRKTEELAAIFE